MPKGSNPLSDIKIVLGLNENEPFLAYDLGFLKMSFASRDDARIFSNDIQGILFNNSQTYSGSNFMIIRRENELEMVTKSGNHPFDRELLEAIYQDVTAKIAPVT